MGKYLAIKFRETKENLYLLMLFRLYFLFFVRKMFQCDIKVKIVLSVLCFRLFANVFILKRETKGREEKVLSNKTKFFVLM
jgi:ABC-type uncharacterized transport system permease subunit